MEALLEKIRVEALKYGPGWLEQQVQGFQPPVLAGGGQDSAVRRSGRQRTANTRSVAETPGARKRQWSPSRDPQASSSYQTPRGAGKRSGRNPPRRSGSAAGGASASSGGDRRKEAVTAPPADVPGRGKAKSSSRRVDDRTQDGRSAASAAAGGSRASGTGSVRGSVERAEEILPEVERRRPSCEGQVSQEEEEDSQRCASGGGPEPERQPPRRSAVHIDQDIELLPAGSGSEDWDLDVPEEEEEAAPPCAERRKDGQRSEQRGRPRSTGAGSGNGAGQAPVQHVDRRDAGASGSGVTAAGDLPRGRPGECTTNVMPCFDVGVGVGSMGWFWQGLQDLFVRGAQAAGASPVSVWGESQGGVGGPVGGRRKGGNSTGTSGAGSTVVAGDVATRGSAVSNHGMQGQAGSCGVGGNVVSGEGLSGGSAVGIAGVQGQAGSSGVGVAVVAKEGTAVTPVVAEVTGSKVVDDIRLGDAAKGQIYVCFEGPLGSHVKQEVREKIWKDEFVEIFSLLPLEKFNLDRGKPDESKKEEEERRRYRWIPRTFANWLQAFSILASVIGEKAPENCSGLFCYQDMIGEAYRVYGGTGWLRYDEEFRQRKAVRPSVRWDHKDISLWMKLITAPKAAARPFQSAAGGSGSAAGRSAGVGKGCCWQFNEGQCKYGAECRFKHECSGCGGVSHPLVRCFKRGKGKGGEGDTKRGDSGDVGKDVAMAKGVPR